MTIFRNITSRLLLTATAIAAAATVTSCDSMIYDDQEECYTEIRFVYDYNMEKANAFYSQVDCLTLFVYDKDGNFLSRHTETSAALADENYRMRLNLDDGQYTLVAYGGMECEKSTFSFIADPSTLDRDGRRVALTTVDADGVSSAPLHPHFFGMTDIAIAPGKNTSVRMEMMKNTNNFRIILQHLNKRPVLSKDFNFEIIDDNALFNHDNSLLPSQGVTYKPFALGETNNGWNTDGTDNVAAYFELATSRLIDYPDPKVSRAPGGTNPGSTSVDYPRLRITRADTGSTVVDIPLIKYLKLYKAEADAKMPVQEFLDRESRWNMIFFLDERDVWSEAYIVVNDYTVRINDIDDF